MSKDCETIREALSAFADRELSEHASSRVQAHLEHCPECRQLARDYEGVGGLIRESLFGEADRVDFAPMHRGVQEAIRASKIEKSAPSSGVGWARRWAWQASLAIAFGAVLVLLWIMPRGEQAERYAQQEVLQEQLGQAIRSAAGFRYEARKVSALHQERLGELIREDRAYRIGLRPMGTGLEPGRMQEQLGVVIRDHARSQWTMNQQMGEIQERLGRLIRDQARMRTKNL